MNIETKYNIGQEVFCILNTTVNRHKITGIDIKVFSADLTVGKGYRVTYSLDSDAVYKDKVTEENLFKTKEELLASL